MGSALTLDAVRRQAREASPELGAAREALAVAAGEERQAGALTNPNLAYAREKTRDGGRENTQDIALFEQRLEIAGQRGLRRDAARQRREAAERRLAWAELELDFAVTRIFASAVAADARFETAAATSRIFAQARAASSRRRSEGDISGYEDRRIRLEAARYTGLGADAEANRELARSALAAVLSPDGNRSRLREVRLDVPSLPPAQAPELETLVRLALERRADLAAEQREQEALETEARLRAREAVPSPTAGAGYKTERNAGESDRFDGFVVQLSVPFPLWDRQQGARDAARADARRASLELQRKRREVTLEVEEAWRLLRALQTRLEALGPELDADRDIVLRSARTAYDEGEVTLVEWLDAVRANYEVRLEVVALHSDALVRRAALERAIGGPLP
jgi:outer membrane protein, heavy metal efflux system